MTERSGAPADGLEWFGREISEALLHKGVTPQELADATGYEVPYVLKVSSGTALPSTAFAKGCDRYFGTSGWFTRLLNRLNERGHPGWFVPYLKLEREAARIEDYSNTFVMGMLQVPSYAEAAFRASHPRESDDQIRARVDARMRRREVMDTTTPPLLWIILHEAVLCTVVGSRAIMTSQLRHLVRQAASPHITLQVLRFAAGAPASSAAFTLLKPNDGPTVVYSEARELGHVNDSAAAVGNARTAYERLRASALSPDLSVSFIREIAEEHSR
ncbi:MULTISPECIES: helix-turn-helix transcriptional regulator [unclassified Streptomyces]|uniref:helix-turn-helix domain-containing protein n=1 Tax=unclassified Streptomyces TaxID=2593676 RepID=UPI0033213123